MFSFFHGWAALQEGPWDGLGRAFDRSGELRFPNQCEVLGLLCFGGFQFFDEFFMKFFASHFALNVEDLGTRGQ